MELNNCCRNKGLSNGAIAAIYIVCILVVAAISGFVIFKWRKSNIDKEEENVVKEMLFV